jgi:hypothetical protein
MIANTWGCRYTTIACEINVEPNIYDGALLSELHAKHAKNVSCVSKSEQRYSLLVAQERVDGL